MAMISSDGFSHVRLTVTDIHRSKDFYDRVFGWPAVIDQSAHVEEAGIRMSRARFFGGVLYATPQGTLFGLRPVSDDRFDPDRTGLDHVSFAVADRDALVAAEEELTRAGIPHGRVTDLPDGASILSFQDPDDINLELMAPPQH